MFRIGTFSKLGMTTVKTLRYYDEQGLLQPEQTDPLTGYRLYTTAQLTMLHRIQSLRQAGLSIEDIRLYLSSGQGQREILLALKARLTEQLSETSAQLSHLEFLLQEEIPMHYAVTIKQLPEYTVYSKKMVVPSCKDYFKLIPAIGEKVSAKYPDLKCAVPEYCFIRSLDGEYKEKNLHVEFCEAVEGLRPDFEDIVFKTVPPVTAASVIHKGAYGRIREAYAFLLEWMEENGYVLADAPRENYIDGIWNKQDEADWLTEIQIPVIQL